jgi:hypothetical protein
MKRLITYAIVGALAFWAPDILVAAVTRQPFVELVPRGWLGLCMLTFAPLACLSCAVWPARRIQPGMTVTRTVAYMVMGVWSFGPLLMMIAVTLGSTDGGFHKSAGQIAILVAAGIVVPFVTFVMSTYDGSLLAVLLATVGLLVILAIEHSWPMRRQQHVSTSLLQPYN